MRKNLTTIVCALLIVIPTLLSAQKPSQASKSGTKTTTSVVKPATVKPTVTKPTVTTSVRNTEIKKTTPVTTVHSHPTSSAVSKPIEVKEVKPTEISPIKPIEVQSHAEPAMQGPVFSPEKTTSGTISGPPSTIKQEALIWQSYIQYRYQNCRRARSENRHCGCGADIQLVNPTNETLDIYITYVSSSALPTMENTAMPEIRSGFQYPTFVIAPGETITIRGTCNGGILYEVTSHYDKSMGKKNSSVAYTNPAFIDHGFIRNNCINKTVVFENEKD
jgi:hypothetical protein